MHQKLLSQGRGSEKLPGEFRRSQNWIGGTRPGNAHFVPPPPQEIENCMADLERYLHATHDGTPALIRAALAHVQFETIHPFLDGNGRLGRLLISLFLHAAGALTQPLLYLSLFLKQHRTTYYELLGRVRTNGEWEAWVDFFLEGVTETAQGAVQTARRLVALFEQDAQRVRALGRSSGSVGQVLAFFSQRPVCSLKQLVNNHGTSFPRAARGVQALIELNIVRELTGQRRNRVFVYDAYLNILNEGGEPL